MKTLIRGLRGITRSPMRTLLLIILLAVSLSLSLTMLEVSNAFGNQINQIRSGVGTDIYLRPSESLPEETSTMPENDLSALMKVSDVAKIGKKLNLPYEGKALIPAKLSEESKKVLGGRGLDADSADKAANNMEVSLIGSNTPDALSVRGRVTTGLGVTVQPSKNVTINDGRTFTTEEMNANVAVISKPLAETNGLKVGDTLPINGTSLKIIGTFTADAGDLFGQNAIFLPLQTAQRVLDKAGLITEAVIYADDVEHVDQVVKEIGNIITNPNLTTNVEAFDKLAAPLKNAQRGSQTGMVASMAACVAIILFAMLLTVRGRMKEIGILKAVGASNKDVIWQFGVETLSISLVAAVIAGIVTYLFAGGIASGMVANTAVESTSDAGQLAVSISPIVFGYSLGIAAALALIGSCIPAWSVARIKPAEVLRYE